MNIYGSLMNIFDEKNIDFFDKKKTFLTKEQNIFDEKTNNLRRI